MLHWPWVTAIHGYLLQKSLPSNEKGMFFIGGTFAMAIQIGINGFGRIGSCLLYTSKRGEDANSCF